MRSALVAALLVLVGCGYPDFKFRSSEGHGGASTTTASNGSGGAGGGANEGTVPCIDGKACAPGEVCCYSRHSAAEDRCDQAAACPPSDFATFACNTNADCPTLTVCCAQDTSGDGALDSVGCAPACTPPSVPMCGVDEECEGNVCYPFMKYPGYGWCQKPKPQ